MDAAKRVKARIEKPRGKDAKKKGEAKPDDFTAVDFSKAAFQVSVNDPKALPAPGAPEIAFVGRSNAGKSSAINTLANRRRLAFVSKTPGRTQLINFFSLGPAAFLVDLPGYGYAGVPGATRKHWETLVGDYVAQRESLALVVVVMDIRRPLTDLDKRLLDWLHAAERRAHILLTKADKLSRQAANEVLARVKAELAKEKIGATVQLFSSSKRAGIEAASEEIGRAMHAFRTHKTRAPPKGE
jgi:GTP-binding protein